jgi:DNA topoisomerase I
MPRVHRADCSEPGIRRIRCGGGFRYADEHGESVGRGARSRIEQLAIPPAWTEVWICPDPYGHIQATGCDVAGRKQYLYHERWRVLRDRKKFDQALEFARSLPKLRRRVQRDLRRRGLVRERVLGCAVRLLDLGLLRIGTEQYAKDNGTYGVATLKKSHVGFEGDAIVLEFKGKGDRSELQRIEDPQVLSTVRALKRRRGGGAELLAYRQRDGSWCDLRSEQINAYLKELTGDEFSAKYFRTWNATMLAAVEIAGAEDGKPLTKAARERAINQAVRQVASYLGNTPAVCRSSYIDPRVFDRFRDGETIRGALDQSSRRNGALPSARGALEKAVLRLIG